MKKVHPAPKRGFTLIELLVVIAIVSLLASIVLSSLGAAREKALNSSLNSQVLEYGKALELYRISAGKYPPTTPDLSCLADDMNDRCGGLNSSGTGHYFTNSTVTSYFRPLMGSIPTITSNKTSTQYGFQLTLMPINENPPLGQGDWIADSQNSFKTWYGFVGILYRSYVPAALNNGTVLSSGTGAQIIWGLKKTDAGCARPPGAFKVLSGNMMGKFTICTALFK